jgi:hypothetical protein
VTASEHRPPSALLRALETARALGRADGRIAFEVEPDGEPGALGSWCHGRGPDDFARLVWDDGAGTAPAGVRLNAPLWYALGFREALRDQALPAAPDRVPGPPWRSPQEDRRAR